MTSKKSKKTPNPGSDKAIALGCTCPVLDNSRGKGYMGCPGFFVYHIDCKVHAETSKRIFESQECG